MKRIHGFIIAIALLVASGLFMPVPDMPRSDVEGTWSWPVINSVIPTLSAQGTNPNNLNGLDRRLIQYVANKVLTPANVITTLTAPITVIGAYGAGTIIEPLGGFIAYRYVSTAFTVGANTDWKLYFTNRVTGPAASDKIETTGLLDQTADTQENFAGVPSNETGTFVNVPIVLQAMSAGGLSGGGTSSVFVRLAYRVHNK